MIYDLLEVKRELQKRLLDVDTMIAWNDFLDMIEEEKPRKVYVIYGYRLIDKDI